MAQQGFGRRGTASPAVADARTGRHHPAGASSKRSAGASVAVLAAVAGVVMLVALGGVVALNAATSSTRTVAKEPAVPLECRGEPECANQYSVALACTSDEARTVSVVAADADAAERKAERYNRDCRSRGAVFVASIVRSAAAGNAAAAPRAKEPPKSESAKKTAGAGGLRARRR